MQTVFSRWAGAILVSVALQTVPMPAGADSTQTSSTPSDHVAIQGYDVVSYFTDGKPVKGIRDISLPFDDATWQFANASHKQMFEADPDRYLPQYGGMCASGMAMGVSVPADPENWAIVDGKLYIVSGGAADLADWKAHAAENIKAADAQWAKLQGQ
jgi:hypothetical protein